MISKRPGDTEEMSIAREDMWPSLSESSLLNSA